ncbi:MAG: hypothetical protein IKK08_09635 [Clostridia bacterium]|nr:hypothetical protein [Clostridia bacterium]
MNQFRQNPFMFYLRTLTYVLSALGLRLVAFAPLLLLLLPAGSFWRWFALLTPLMLIFMVLPLRYSFADAIVQKPRQRCFSFDTAFSVENYGEKLGESLLHALNVIKWGIPLLAMLLFAGWYYLFPLEENSIGILKLLNEIGEWGAGVWYGVSDFFVRLFGGIPAEHVKGGWLEGLAVLVIALGIGLLILLYGIVRNSCNRYIWVVATREERTPRTEIRRRMRGRRWLQLLVALGNLVLLAPFLVFALLNVFHSLGSVSDALSGMLMGGGMQLDLSNLTIPLALAFVLLYLPLLPVRRIITANFATARRRHAVPGDDAAGMPDSPMTRSIHASQTVSDVPMPEAPVVFDWVKRESIGYYPKAEPVEAKENHEA